VGRVVRRALQPRRNSAPKTPVEPDTQTSEEIAGSISFSEGYLTDFKKKN